MPGSTFTHGYALLIGVGEMQNPKFSLPVTVQDMNALAIILVDPNQCGYVDDDDHIRLLFDEGATRTAILDGLAWLQTQAANDPDATAIVFYSGHGALDLNDLRYFLLPHDFDAADLPGTALAAEDFTQALQQIPAKRLLVLIDACHAEGMATAKDEAADLLSQAPPNPMLSALKQGEGRAVFTSSRGKQQSWVRKDNSMSIYTYHLLEALQGAGNISGDNVVRLSNLMNHLGKTVPESAQSQHQQSQTPFFDTATEDFPIAILRGGKGLPAGGWDAVAEKAEEKIRSLMTINVQGDGNVTASGNMENNTIVTGNNNVLGNNNNVTNARRIDTGGGAFIGGSVNTGGGEFVGRDKIVGASAVSTASLDALFAPLIALAQGNASAQKSLQSIRSEAAKGSAANDERLGDLISALYGQLPALPKSAIVALLTPALGSAAGPITKFVLK